MGACSYAAQPALHLYIASLRAYTADVLANGLGYDGDLTLSIFACSVSDRLSDAITDLGTNQCCDLETMVSRLECTRVHFVQVFVSVSRPEWPRSQSWSRDLKSKVLVLISRRKDQCYFSYGFSVAVIVVIHQLHFQLQLCNFLFFSFNFIYSCDFSFTVTVTVFQFLFLFQLVILRKNCTSA